MGVEERYKKRKEEEKTNTLYNGVENRYLSKNVESVAKEMNDRVNTWLTNNNNYISNAQNRFSGENTTYRTDASDWLTTVQTQRENFQKEAESIKSVLTTYKDFFSEDYVNSVFEALDGNLKAQDSVIDVSNKDLEYWSQWESEESYNKWYGGWLDPEAETNEDTVALRQSQYQSNAERISELEKQMPWYVGDVTPNFIENWFLSDEQEALRDELEALKAEQNQYERTQKTIDDYYKPVTDEFLANAAYRDYTNASREELWAYDVQGMQGSVALNSGGYFDDEGNIRDSKGNIVQAANAPVVEDKLGLFLSATNDEIIEAYNELLATNGNYNNTWADYIQEGDVNGWKHLKENEINIYYDLLKREGQESAYRYLEAMTTELTRRATQEVSDAINKTEGLEQVFLNVASIPLNVFGGLTSFVDDAANVLSGEEINPYSRAHLLQNAATDIRSKTATDIDKATGGFEIPLIDFSVGDTYQALMSGADSLLGAAIGGNAYGVLMGMGSASSTARDLYEKGAGTGQIITGSLLAGAAEMFFEKYSIDKLVEAKDAKSIKDIIVNMLTQSGVEATEEMATEIANTITNYLVMGSQSDWVDLGTFVKNVVNAGLSGAISGGGTAGIYSVAQKAAYNKQVKEYGQSIIDRDGVADLQATAAEMSDNKAVTKLANKVAKKISAKNVGKLATAIQGVIDAKDSASIAADLVNKGLSKKEAQKVTDFVMKTAQGYEATAEEIAEIEKITDKLPDVDDTTAEYGAEEYGRLLQNMEAETTETADVKAPAKAVSEAKTVEAAEVAQTENVAAQDNAEEAKTVSATENAPVKENTTEGEISAHADVVNTEESNVTLESASKKYGAQAGAMISTYTEGQDVAKYDAAYSAAYDMGKSGVNLSYAMNSEATAYLTESQRELAHAAGADASSITAKAQDAENKSKVNGKSGRRKGVVRGEGVTISDLKKSFNDTQGVAYKLLSTYAEATGVDIVLYKSEVDADGNFVGSQGKFKWSEDTIYIDVNAGLVNNSVTDLEKYTMMRTFSHEFTHFIEKWNPIWYNEFRKVVFDTLTERGENVEDLIETKMSQSEGMTYDAASREVVAEAMTDILPDANFVEELATKHRTIFDKLLEKLKEFLADLKAYFSTIGHNSSREANALKEQVGEGVKYVENIVKLFDKVAVEAVENYQATVAIEETDYLTEVANGQQTAETQTADRRGTRGDDKRNNTGEPRSRTHTAEKSEMQSVQTQDSENGEMQSALSAGNTEGDNHREENLRGVRAEVSDKKAEEPTVEEAKRELKKAVRMPIQGTNEEALVAGILSKELSMESISLDGKVPGFTAEQRAHLVEKLIEGVYTDKTVIKIDVPYDGKFEIKNTTESVAQVLNALKVKVNQEIVLDKKTMNYFKQAARTVVMKYDGQDYLTEGILMLPVSESGAKLAISELKSQVADFPQIMKNAFDNANIPITKAPLEAQYRNNPVYVFDVGDKKLYYDKKRFSFIDGGLLYYAENGAGTIIKSVNEDGSVRGYLLSMKTPDTDIADGKPTKLRSFSKKMQSLINNTEEGKLNGENADNRGTVQQSDTDRQGDTQVLEGLQADDVQGDVQRGDSVGDPVERGQETRRDDNRADIGERSRGRSGDGDSKVGDIRRDGGDGGRDRGDGAGQTRTGDVGALQGDKSVSRGSEQPSGREESVREKSTEALHEEVTEQIAQQSTEKPKGRNFVIGDSLDLPNGEKARYKANIEAIRLVKQLETEGRYATEAEQVILSKYVGWGGLANAFDQRKTEWAKEYNELKELLSDEEYTSARGSTLNAHFTDISVIKAMYDGLAKLGFNGGRMLEPSSGVGNFVGAMPEALSAKVKSWTMVELDGITGLIAKYLYPNADVRIQGFEKANIPDNYMDVAISNVPFGNYAITDKAYPKKVTSAIHNYFFAKSLDKVRPGGIVMFITSSYTMNSKDSTVRRYIMQRADLLGAIRLPDSAFKGNAGTEVVTDILVLKKRAANTAYAGEDFLEAPWVYPVKGNYNGANINSYFDSHPEMVLGTPSMDGGMYRGGSLTYKALEGRGSLAEQIREAFSHIEGKMEYPATLSREKTNFAVERASKKTKNDGYVSKNGKIYQNKNGELVEQTVNPKVAERISGMLEIRDAARELMTYQQQGLKESEIKKARTKLNKLYDAYVKKNGYLNAPANKSAFKEDPDCFSLYALENYNPETKKATKADIFSKNTIAPNRTVTSAKDVAEGLIVSVNQTGGVDTALIARLTGQTEADVTRELIDSRKAFKNRRGELEAAEVYLSGNVRAKLRDAEALVPIDADYKNNVEALKSVIPADVGYQDIFVNAGTPWIPNSVYSDFAAYMLGGRNTEWRQDVDVTRNRETGNFTVELKSRYLKTNAANTQKWGTSRRSFLDLFDAMLNSKSVVIKDKLDDGSFVVNKDATAAANEKIENIQKEFQEWLWQDENRRTELATLYNETFNSIVTPKYNGDNLTVNGANANKPLRPHQRNAVQRVISSGGNTLLAHKVGAGKTYEMAAAAMKLKELGLVKKPMFAVPKSLVAQWGNEFMDFFPTAKLLVAEASDFTAANRKVFMNRIANGEYDAVIVSYEQFEKLPMSDDFTRELYQEQIDSIVAAIEEAKADKGDKALSVKDLEKKRKSLQAKIDKLTDKAKDEGNIDFEELGVDSLFVDEAHNFKNLFYTTSMTNVSGLGNKDGSKRAFDLYTKVRYLQQLNGGRGIVFATATPVMNSMSEMYIMQKYLQPDLLDQLGLSTFDAWAKQFGEVVNGVEIKPSGQGYRVKQSFSRFKNMSELQLLFRNFADVLTEVPGLKIPTMKGGKVNVVVCEPGQFQQDFMKELERRADNIKNVDPSVDNMLKITSDGRKISYTQRMIDPTLPYEEGCKIFRCADNVIKEYNDSKSIRGTQLIFCDMATPKGSSNNNATETEDIETDMESAQLYDDLKTRLRQGGIPAKEIAFIHEADTDQKKKKLFEDVNEGKVRVLIGSTGKMGVGMNAQKRIVAIHHLDAPWRPGDVEQRDGRAFRQKNINDEVSKYTYVTEGSFDARLWDILDRKQNFINQVMNGENVGRETEDTGEVTLSAAEVKALASGSPLIMEQVELDTAIKKLESLYRAHISAVRSAKERLARDTGEIARLEKQIANGKADIAARVDTYSEEKFSIAVGKMKYTDKKEAGVSLMAEASANANFDGYTTIGSFAGFELRVVRTSEGINGLLVGKQGYPFKTYPGNTTFMISQLIGVAESIDEKVKLWQHNLAEVQKDIAEQEKLINEPFAKQAELDQKRARYNEVMEILNPKEEQSLDSVAEDTVQEQSRDYLKDEDYFTETNTQHENAVDRNFRLATREYSLQEVRNIFKSSNTDPDVDVLFDKVYNFCQEAKIRVASAPVLPGEQRKNSWGVTRGDKIILSQKYYNDDSISPQKKAEVMLHEMIHASTVYAIEAYDIAIKEGATAELPKNIYNSCKEIFSVYAVIKNDKLFAGERGIANVKEMVAELSNPKFVEKLKRTYPSVWHKLLDVICEIFGINKTFSNYAKLKKAVDDIISHPDLEIARGYYVSVRKADYYLDETQYQQRTNTLTDREILAMAAEELQNIEMSEAERDALQIFKKRLAKLEALQEERIEQGRLYKEQQFGAKVDREAAEQTLNRMHVLDDQIKAASADVLSIEDKKVLGDVLKKARKVVEADQRSHDAEILKRWRDRTKNAAAIKKYRERIQKDVGELTSWVLKPNNKDIVKHIPDALKNTVIPFLSSIDFTSKQQLRGGEATKADDKFKNTLKKLNDVLEKQIKPYGENYSDYLDLPPGFVEGIKAYISTVEELVNKHSGEFVINQMTSEELKDLSYIIKVLKNYITQMNTFHNNGVYHHVYEAGNDLISEMSPLAKGSGKTNNFINYQNIRPSYVWERFGRAGIAIRDELQAGQAKYGFNTKTIAEFTEKAYTSQEVKFYRNTTKTFNLGGDAVEMRISHMMGLYLLSKQPDSMRHMLSNKGGLRVASYQKSIRERLKDGGIKEVSTIISDEGHVLTQADIDTIVAELEKIPRAKEVADALQKFMAEQGGAWGNEVSVRRFGEKLFVNPAYYPIKVDNTQMSGKKEEFPEGASLYALLNKSFTKSRTEEAANRIILYDIFDVFSNHMASMAQYNAMALPVLDATKWLDYQQKTESGEWINSVRAELTRVFGSPVGSDDGYAVTFVENILKDFNGTSAQGSTYDSAYMKLLHYANSAKVAMNVRSALLQPTAIVRAGVVLDTRSILSALNPADVKRNTEEMLKYSGIAVWKNLGFYDVNVSRGMREIITHETTIRDKITEKGLWLAETLDRVTWSAIWGAAKKEVVRKHKLTPKDAGFYEAVTKLFEDVIYKTQVVDSVLTKSELMRSKSPIARTAASFMGEPVASLSILTDANEKFNRDKRNVGLSKAFAMNKNHLAKAYSVYAVQAIVVAIAGALAADSWRDDDEYETWLEKFLEAAKSNFLNELDPFGKIPFIADVWESVKAIAIVIVNRIFDTDFYTYSQNTALGEITADLTKGVEILLDLATGEDTKYKPWGAIYALLQGASAISGYPLATTAREFVTVWNNTIAVMYPDLKIKTYDSGDKNEIKYAYQDGYLTFEEAMAELVEQGLVDNENEAYFTVSGWEAGDGYSRYDKVYDAVRTGGSIDEAMAELIAHGYTEKDVLSQVTSQIGKWYYDKESDYRISKQQAIDMLTKYTDLTDEEIVETVNKWSAVVVTGIKYDDIGDEYLAGNITADRAKEMYVRYGSMTEEKATEEVAVLDFVKEHPSLDGENISYAFVSAYTEYCEPQGIDVEVFRDVWQYKSSAVGDKDKNGNTISGSKKAKVLEYINSLDLSKKQKDSLYYAFGWSKSTISDAPWR